jgi:hypothetical protein
VSSGPVARKPGQFADERFRARHRAWLRRVGWLLAAVAVGELAVTVAVGALLQPQRISLYWGLGLGIALTTLIALGDSPPEHIDRWRRGAYGEKATAKRLRGLVRRGWVLVNDIDIGRGNIDHVLIGPPGVFLLESKWLAGLVSVSRGVLTITAREDPDDSYENREFARRARTTAALVACHLRDSGMPGTWVQPVIVLWAKFDQPPVLSDRVAWIQGKQLAGALGRQPVRLTQPDIERAAALVMSRDLSAQRLQGSWLTPAGYHRAVWHERALWRHGWKVFLLPIFVFNHIPGWLRIVCVVGVLGSMVVDLGIWAHERRVNASGDRPG